jgi:uncharacterized membrane protein
MRTPADRDPPSLRIGVPALLLTSALVVAFFGIDSKSFGLDESTSVYYSHFDFGALSRLLTRVDPNMSVYYFALKGWMGLFGDGETSVRSMSAIAGALAVVGLYYVGTAIRGRLVGVTAAVLLMLNAFHVQYAQTARAYSLVTLLVILSTLFFVLETDRPSRRVRIAYVLTSTLAFYAQYFAALVIAAQLLSIVAVRGRAAFTRERIADVLAIAGLCLPGLIIAASVGASVRLDWVNPLSFDQVRWTLVALGGQSALVLISLAALGIFGLVVGVRRREVWPHLLSALWFALPIVVTLIVSLRSPMFVSRFLVVCVPGLILFGTLGLSRLRSTTFGVATAALIAFPAASRLHAWYETRADEEWRAATAYVLAAAKPGDAIKFFPDYMRRPFEYYQHLSTTSGPENLERRPLNESARVWLVVRQYEAESRPEALANVKAALDEAYDRVERRVFPRVSVELFAR